MTTFVTYRNGTGPIETRIKTAMKTFYRSREELPAGIIVNATELDAAQEAVKSLALSVPVISMGGVLIPEIWLECPEPPKTQAGKLSNIIDEVFETGGRTEWTTV